MPLSSLRLSRPFDLHLLNIAPSCSSCGELGYRLQIFRKLVDYSNIGRALSTAARTHPRADLRSNVHRTNRSAHFRSAGMPQSSAERGNIGRVIARHIHMS